LYSQERSRNDEHKGGNFKLAADSFSAGDFYAKPVDKPVDPAKTSARAHKIVQDYNQSQREFPYIFVIGHSNRLDDPEALDKTYGARLQRNWEYAVRRAGVIASLMEQYLTDAQKDRLVVVTTGEFDLKLPSKPNSQENAWVEVVFGKEWKPPTRTTR